MISYFLCKLHVKLDSYILQAKLYSFEPTNCLLVRDQGTSIMYFPHDVFAAFHTAFMAESSSTSSFPSSPCFSPSSDIDTFSQLMHCAVIHFVFPMDFRTWLD